MDNQDKINLGISVTAAAVAALALMLSYLAFHYQYIRDSHLTYAAVLEFNRATEDSTHFSQEGQYTEPVALRLSFANSGNKAVIIERLSLDFDTLAFMITGSGGGYALSGHSVPRGLWTDRDSDSLFIRRPARPILLAPGETIERRYFFNPVLEGDRLIEDVHSLIEDEGLELDPNTTWSVDVSLALSSYVVDSNNNQYESRHRLPGFTYSIRPDSTLGMMSYVTNIVDMHVIHP